VRRHAAVARFRFPQSVAAAAAAFLALSTRKEVHVGDSAVKQSFADIAAGLNCDHRDHRKLGAGLAILAFCIRLTYLHRGGAGAACLAGGGACEARNLSAADLSARAVRATRAPEANARAGIAGHAARGCKAKAALLRRDRALRSTTRECGFCNASA
jgi:hypothetical protein